MDLINELRNFINTVIDERDGPVIKGRPPVDFSNMFEGIRAGIVKENAPQSPEDRQRMYDAWDEAMDTSYRALKRVPWLGDEWFVRGGISGQRAEAFVFRTGGIYEVAWGSYKAGEDYEALHVLANQVSVINEALNKAFNYKLIDPTGAYARIVANANK